MVTILKEPINFSYVDRGHDNDKIETLHIPSWVARYVDVATDLAKQGYVVLMSTHKDVIELLKAYQNHADNENQDKVHTVIFCPKMDMKDAWIDRLQKRYDKSGLPKDFRALQAVKSDYCGKIEFLQKSGLPVYHPETMGYDLRSYISRIRDMHQNALGRKGEL